MVNKLERIALVNSQTLRTINTAGTIFDKLGYKVLTIGTFLSVRDYLSQNNPYVALIDQACSTHNNALDVLLKLREVNQQTPLILLAKHIALAEYINSFAETDPKYNGITKVSYIGRPVERHNIEAALEELGLQKGTTKVNLSNYLRGFWPFRT